MWTLLYAGVEKRMRDWGIAQSLSAQFLSKEHSSVSLYTIEPFDPGAPQFAFDAKAVIKRDRTLVGGVFTGGTIWFQGYFGEPKRSTSGARQAIAYELNDVWWKMERQIFHQTRMVFNGWIGGDPLAGPILVPYILPEVYLGEAITGETTAPQNNGAQITEIVA